MNVHGIMNETGQLVHEQGEQIDIIGEDLFVSYKNMKQARENLVEASDHQRRAKGKYVFLSLLVLLGLAFGALIILAWFDIYILNFFVFS